MDINAAIAEVRKDIDRVSNCGPKSFIFEYERLAEFLALLARAGIREVDFFPIVELDRGITIKLDGRDIDIGITFYE